MRIFLTLLLVPLALAAQDFSDLQTEKAFAGYRYTDGPAWSPDKFLVFCDTPANHVIKWTPGGKPELFPGEFEGPAGAAFDSQGRLYVTETRGRRVVRIDKRGKSETLAARFEGKQLNAPNDIVVRKDGHAWFTDPAFGNQSDRRELDFYGVFHLTPKGDLEAVARLKTRPNGIALSPNGSTLYVADSDQHAVLAWDVDRHGAVSNSRTVLSGIEGVPAGLRADEKGNLYVAARAVFVYSPAGKLLHTIEFNEKPSNLCFGDPDLETLYITTRTSVHRVRLKWKGAAP